jgi:murein L,D-transpeptidase YafK
MKFLKVLFFIPIFLAIILFFYNQLPEKQLPKHTIIDSISVLKNKRQLNVWEKGVLIKSYKISLGKNPIGAKEIEGDNKTPEGLYKIFDKNPKSDYHNNLGISYPNYSDIVKSKKLGKPVGGEIKIHGLPNYLGFLGKLQRNFDWTAGCIALTNSEIDEISNVTKIGTPIYICP